LDKIPRELQETQRTLSLDNVDGVTTLGFLWNPTNDQLQVTKYTTQVQKQNPQRVKKRKVLATTATIFDPRGLLCPAIVDYKVFLQKLCQDKLK